MSQDPEIVQDELATLKERADKLNITYHPSIGVEKLREKVLAAMADKPGEGPVPPVEGGEPQSQAPQPVAAPQAETEAQRRRRMKDAATALVRIRVTCMNPAKKEWDGEIFTVGNRLVGSITKYVPFNADEGWHVPRILLEQLQARQCQVFTTIKTNRGVAVRQGKLIKEFAIEILDPLTTEELHDLAQRQAMARSID